MPLLNPKTVLITGATGSIGAALAKAYASPGVILILQGRNEKRLEEIKDGCQEKGATVITQLLDLRDINVLSTWIKGILDQTEIDLVIASAGLNTNTGLKREGEPWEEVHNLVKVNILAVMATVDAVLPSMRSRKRGQIVLMGSLAAHFGLPSTPSYCASKAAMRAYGESLRGWLSPEGIQINVVIPGYVESQMCRNMPGPKPFLLDAEKAAQYIKKGLKRDLPKISFPFPLNLGTRLLTLLPGQLATKIVQRYCS